MRIAEGRTPLLDLLELRLAGRVQGRQRRDQLARVVLDLDAEVSGR